MEETITVSKNNDKTWQVNFTYSSTGLPINITGYTIYFTVKDSDSDPDEAALIAVSTTVHDNPTGGVSHISLSAAQTDIEPATYLYDLLLVDGQGRRTSSRVGNFVVEQVIKQD